MCFVRQILPTISRFTVHCTFNWDIFVVNWLPDYDISITTCTIVTQPQFPSLCKSFLIQFGHTRTHKHCSPEMLTLLQRFRDLWTPTLCNLNWAVLWRHGVPLHSVPALERQNDHCWYRRTNRNDHIQTPLSHLWSHQLQFHSQS
jgi:hypothetical protein